MLIILSRTSGRGWDTALVQAPRANRQSENRILHGGRPSRIVVRGWAVLSVLFFYRGVTEWHALDIDAEGCFCL